MILRSLTLLVSLLLFPFNVHAQSSFKVQLETVEDFKSVLATVQTVDLIPARARIGGTVELLLVDEGSRVQSGHVIARIKDEKLELEKQAVEARAASLQAERKLASIALTRAQKLRKTGAGSQAKLDEARTNLDVVLKNLKALESELELVLQREREGTVVAPTNGRVLRVNVIEGSVVLPGEEIASIADETYILRLEVPERHARFIKTGDNVVVGARGMAKFSENQRSGTVRQVYPELVNGRVIADVNVDVIGDFFIGERVQVSLSTGSRETYLIPANLVHSKHGLHFVRLIQGQDIVVVPGAKRGDLVEILSGVKTGDELVEWNK